MCCEVNLAETETSAPIEAAANRRMEIHQFNFVPKDSTVAPPLESRGKRKRPKLDAVVPVMCENAARTCKIQRVDDDERNELNGEVEPEMKSMMPNSASENEIEEVPVHPKFGMTSVCGRRRDMEDAVAIHPSFCNPNPNFPSGMHFFGVYDGHGCSHVCLGSTPRFIFITFC